MNSRFRVLILSTSTCLLILLLAGAHLGRSASTSDDAYRHMAVFAEVMSRIKSDYVEEPDLKNVSLGAVNGLLEAVDPFASYLNAEQYKQYMKEKDALKGDVGMVLAKRFGYVTVVSVLPGSPAAQVGISSGDLIENIKGIATRDMPLAYAELLLKGQPGTTVDLSLLHLPDPETQKTTLTRAAIAIPPLTGRILAEGVGYIRPETLVTGKSTEIAAAVKNLERQGAKGLILDLRQCALGTPEEGVAVANLFLNKGSIGYVSGQRTGRQDFQADPAKAITSMPLVVATNRGTADGAEITAMALLDNKRAEVIGERTFGDAGVRKAITLEDGGALILSVAKYYSPQGKSIQDNGVVPTVPFTEEDTDVQEDDDSVSQPLAPKAVVRPEEDNLLRKAREVLAKGPGTQPAAEQAAGPAHPTPKDAQPGPLGVPR